MSSISDFFPFDQSALQAGPARVLYAPTSVAVPADLDAVIDPKSTYGPKTGWLDFGATSDAPQISRNLTTGGFTIQQSDVQLLEEVTETVRQVSVPVAQLTPAAVAILEQSAGVESTTGYDSVPFGSIIDLSAYRIALIWRLKKSQKTVTEPGPLTRGAMVGYIAYNCNLTADNVQVSIGRNTLASATLTFKANLDPTITAEGTEMGLWAFEKVRTLT